ncbi:MAG: hypothetical protein KDD70_03735 [Bdellovibrionales bacterium]|nr:hypothetical protein [Bdellovibrionales bacterium]
MAGCYVKIFIGKRLLVAALEVHFSRFVVRHGVELNFIDDARRLWDWWWSSEVRKLERVLDLLDF